MIGRSLIVSRVVLVSRFSFIVCLSHPSVVPAIDQVAGDAFGPLVGYRLICYLDHIEMADSSQEKNHNGAKKCIGDCIMVSDIPASMDHTLHAIYHIEKVPADSTMREILDEGSPRAFRSAFREIF